MRNSKKRKSSKGNSLALYKKEEKRLAPLYRMRNRALERLVATFERYNAGDDDSGDELTAAMDALALAQVAVTFQFLTGPHK